MNKHVAVCLIASAVVMTTQAAEIVPAAIKVTGLNFAVAPVFIGQSTIPEFTLVDPAPVGTLAFTDAVNGPVRPRTNVDRASEGMLSLPSGNVDASWNRFDSSVKTDIDTSQVTDLNSHVSKGTFSQVENFVLGPKSVLTISATVSFYLPENKAEIDAGFAPWQNQFGSNVDFVYLESAVEASFDIKKSSTASNSAFYDPDANASPYFSAFILETVATPTDISIDSGTYISSGDFLPDTINDGIFNRSITLTATYRNNDATRPFYGEFQYLVSSASTYGISFAVPEPSTWTLMAMGLLGVFGASKRRNRG